MLWGQGALGAHWVERCSWGTGGGRCYRAPVSQKTEKETGIKQRQGAQADSGRVMGDRDPRTPGVRAGAPSLALGDCRMHEELKSGRGGLAGGELSKAFPPGPQSLTTRLPLQPPTPLFSGEALGSQRTLPSNSLEN